MSQRVTARGEVKLGSEPQRKRVFKRATFESRAVDAKPGELPMGRLKRG